MGDLGFLFNEMNFSDRVLRIEIISQDSSDSVVKVTTLNISSRILASESSFFYKLFKNGMKESRQKKVTLKIDASEEAPLMDLLNAMYINILSATTTPELLGVLIVADKFEVTSCMRYCSNLLEKLHTPLEYQLCYPQLPRVLMNKGVAQLKDAAKKYIIERYMDFNKFQEERMGLPLCALEVILGSDGLRVKSEDDVFDFILKWGRAHYPKLEERREILTSRLARFIYFQHMCPFKMKKITTYPDFDKERMWKLFKKSLQLTAGFPYGQCMHIPGPHAPTTTTTTTTMRRRVYEYHLVKVEYFSYSPRPCTNVYFNLTRQECMNLFQSRQLSSKPFIIHGLRWFRLMARCNKEDYFGLFLCKTPPPPPEEEVEKDEKEEDTIKKNNEICTIDCEFQVIKDLAKGFESKHMIDKCTLTEGDCVGKENLFGISWKNLMADDSHYFIDGILHLRIQLILIDHWEERAAPLPVNISQALNIPS